MGLYLLFPYLNKLATNLTKNDYLKFLLVLIGLFSLYSFAGDTFLAHNGYSLIWFVVLYFIGGYIRLFDVVYEKKKLFIFYVSMCLFTFFAKIISCNIGYYFGIPDQGLKILYCYNSPIVLCSSIALFLFFKNTEIANVLVVRLVIFFAPLTFGVYLIHNNNFVNKILWKDLLDTSAFHDSSFFLFHYILSIIIIFVVCALIEFVRKTIFCCILNLKSNMSKGDGSFWTL